MWHMYARSLWLKQSQAVQAAYTFFLLPVRAFKWNVLLFDGSLSSLWVVYCIVVAKRVCFWFFLTKKSDLCKNKNIKNFFSFLPPSQFILFQSKLHLDTQYFCSLFFCRHFVSGNTPAIIILLPPNCHNDEQMRNIELLNEWVKVGHR